jgi:hypothetical protein
MPGHSSSLDGMPVVEGLAFHYALHELPLGRLSLRRWRWELWHGPRLEAAGWRLSRREAARALRLHGSRVGHRLFGLKPPPDDAGSIPALRPGASVRVSHGGVAFALVPVHLESAPAPVAL